MVEQKKPTCTEEEIDGYVWDLANNRKKGEEPVDKDNHGLDALRYLVAFFDLDAVDTIFRYDDIQACLTDRVAPLLGPYLEDLT
jgi:hypothetical protein